jgi:hypothetical protein
MPPLLCSSSAFINNSYFFFYLYILISRSQAPPVSSKKKSRCVIGSNDQSTRHYLSFLIPHLGNVSQFHVVHHSATIVTKWPKLCTSIYHSINRSCRTTRESFNWITNRQQNQITLFFLEHAGELRIFVLRRENSPITKNQHPTLDQNGGWC